MFSHYNKKTVRYEEAKEACKAENEELATVKNQDEWQELVSFVDSENEYGYWWLGADKEEASEQYYWTDGTPYSEFSQNLTINQDQIGKRCIALYTRNSESLTKVFSMPCDRHLFFICKETSVTTRGLVEGSLLNSTSAYSTAGKTNSLVHTLTRAAGDFTTSLPSISNNPCDVMNSEAAFTEREVFSPSSESDMDPVAWMFVSLGLALLLVIALVIIAKLWTDIKSLRDRLDTNMYTTTTGRYNSTKISDTNEAITID